MQKSPPPKKKKKKKKKKVAQRVAYHYRADCNFNFGTICITIVSVSAFFGQSDQMRCQNVRN